MSFFNWRKLNFFDVAKDIDGGAVYNKITGESDGSVVVKCCTSGRGHVVFGDNVGNVWIFNRHWESTCLAGWEGEGATVTQLEIPKQTGILIGLGRESGLKCLKIWDLEKVDKTGQPKLLRVARLTIAGSPSEVSHFAVSDNLQLLAVAFDSGAVCLYRGEVTRDKAQKPKVLLERGDQITGMCFKFNATGHLLYLATTRDVFLLDVTQKDRETRSVLDTQGCDRPGLCTPTFNYSHGDFITGQKDALYFYNPEGRGQCYVYEGKKKILYWYRGYLVVVVEEAPEKFLLTLFDVTNKIIAFSAPLKPFQCVVAEWGSIFLVTEEGKLSQLIEKDLQTKLELLFRKNFYDVAIKIVRNQQYDKEGLVDIFRQYGDHLYEKGDHTGAIDQYEKTIGTLEPSYVIRKYLDAQKIHNLTAYLQALHRKGFATEDHTTLLLNCYTKLKDSQKLDEFIMTKDREVDFDVNIAITVCSQAGYCRHALALAEKHKKHDLYLKIQIDNQQNYEKALQYITKLDPKEAEGQLKRYGGILMSELPAETTKLLKDMVYTEDSMEAGLSRPEDFINLFLASRPADLIDYLEHVLSTSHGKTVNAEIYNTLIEHRLQLYKKATSQEEKKKYEEKLMEMLTSEDFHYDPDQVLVFCQLADFSAGFLYLYQVAGLHLEILKHHFQGANYESGMVACRRYGPQNPQIWVAALRYVASSGVDVPQDYVKEVLDNIEHYRLLSPLQVISTLSTCPSATLGVVRDYLLRMLEAEQTALEDDRKAIENYKTETEHLKSRIETLKTEALVFQSTRCSGCNNPLELPTVHFLCQHGYHQHCLQSLADNDKECPACQGDNKKILDIIKAQEAGRNRHDQFHAQLEKAEDGFSIIAEYFGRGLFNPPPTIAQINANNMAFRKKQDFGQSIADNLSSLNVTEARLRASDKNVGQLGDTRTEARLRLDGGKASPGYGAESEGRLRVGQPSQANYMIPSDARLRLDERGGQRSPASAGRKSPVAAGSLSSNIVRQSPRQDVRMSRSQQGSPKVPNKGSISPANPFGSPDSRSSESLGDNNPFASSARPAERARVSPGGGAANPFGPVDDYDEELNPFAD